MKIVDPTRTFLRPPAKADLRPLEPHERWIWIRKSLDPADYRRIAGLCEHRDDVGLWINNTDEDLSLLEFFTSVRRIRVGNLRLRCLAGLEHASDFLEVLWIGDTLRKPALEPIRRFADLRELHLDGHTKNVDVLRDLTKLERLRLRSMTLPDLDVLRPLNGLRSLELHLGGTTNLAALPEIGRIRHLDISHVRRLTDLSCLGSMLHLQRLCLQAMRSVSELPSLAGAVSLRRVALANMKGLVDLTPVAEAPALEARQPTQEP
jgi:hypothetical protein